MSAKKNWFSFNQMRNWRYWSVNLGMVTCITRRMVLQSVEVRVQGSALVTVAERECERLCAAIDTAKSPSEREHFLTELKRLADDVLDCIRALDPSAALELDEFDEFEAAA